MRTYKRTYFYLLLIATLAIMGATSCSTSRRAASYEAKPMSTNKIIRKIERGAPSFKSYESNRISISYTDKEGRSNFSGQFKIDHDNRIIFTLRKLSIPVGRALITPDSVVFVNYFDKNYIRDNISSLQQAFGIDIDYYMLQALLTGDIGLLFNNPMFDKELESLIDDNQYRIDSKLNARIDKAISKGNERKLNRYMKRMNDSEFTSYSAWIDPRQFVIRKLTFNDIKNELQLAVHYDNYKLIDKSLFPQNIEIVYVTPIQNMKLEIKLSKAAVNKEKDFSFNIPEKFDHFHF
ncbi:MAG TPA: DUF4292 domain-containing protein [Prolixibacteraceae bacterium]|nr:DUF4292 domain-containing protein [Prolixibacteraceae bacterium]